MSRVRARRRFGALTASLLAALFALAAAGGGSPAGVGGCAPADRAADRGPDNATLACAACRLRGEMRQIRLAAIRDHVLAKLEFSQAPNTTGRVLPDVPQDILTQFSEQRERERSPESEMQGDEPPAAKYLRHRDEDRFHATTDRIIAFPRLWSCGVLVGDGDVKNEQLRLLFLLDFEDNFNEQFAGLVG